MNYLIRHPVRLLLAWAAALTLASIPAPADEIISKELKKFIPYRNHHPIAGKAIGVMVSDAQPVLSTEGRSGPLDEVCFCQDGHSYRWVYVQSPTGGITNLQVPVGQAGQTKIYPRLDLATAKSVKLVGMNTLFALVEVEVNDGLGSPPNDSFVATKLKVLDGTEQYPIKVAEVIDQLKKDYSKYCSTENAQLETEMAKARKAAIKDEKPTDPRTKSDLMYITWMTDDSTLQVFFVSKMTEGHYKYTQGKPGPFPLPVPPAPIDRKLPPVPKQGAAAVQPVAFPPPPPVFQFKTGTTYGIEFGRMYIVSKNGKITQTQNLPVQPFTQFLPPPPGGIGGPIADPPPLPVPPIKKGQ